MIRETNEHNEGNKKRGRKIPALQRSLCFAVHSLQNVEVVIELKNDKEVRGLVRSCDEDMNVLLENVSIKKFNEEFEFFEEMLVKGKSIRYIHYPTFINLETETRLQMKKLKEKEKTRQPPKIVEKVTSILEKRKIEEIVLDNSKSVDIDNDDER